MMMNFRDPARGRGDVGEAGLGPRAPAPPPHDEQPQVVYTQITTIKSLILEPSFDALISQNRSFHIILLERQALSEYVYVTNVPLSHSETSSESGASTSATSVRSGHSASAVSRHSAASTAIHSGAAGTDQ